MATPGAFDYTQAVALYNTERYVECVVLCRKGVETGDAKAQSLLGRCYYCARGLVKDDYHAVRLAKLSAAQNEPLGLHLLGFCHRDGRGALKRDEAKAAELFRQAAAYGCPEGQSDFGYMLGTGTGVAKDRAEGERLHGRAASQGHGVGLFNVAATASFRHEEMQGYLPSQIINQNGAKIWI